jgi:hypothetical protein
VVLELMWPESPRTVKNAHSARTPFSESTLIRGEEAQRRSQQEISGEKPLQGKRRAIIVWSVLAKQINPQRKVRKCAFEIHSSDNHLHFSVIEGTRSISEAAKYRCAI